MKRIKINKKVILIMVILSILVVSIIYIANISRIKRNYNIKTEQIVHINVLPTAKEFYFEKGRVNFYPDKKSVYGNENNKELFAVNHNQSYWFSMRDDSLIRLNRNPKISYYKGAYDSYLKIFENLKINKRALNIQIITLSKGELKKSIPRVPSQDNSGDGYFRLSIYYPLSKGNEIISVRIRLNKLSQPTLVSASTMKSPNTYVPLYELAYDNNISAYNIGFNRMLTKLKNMPELKEPLDD